MKQIALTHEEFLAAIRDYAIGVRNLEKCEEVIVSLCTDGTQAIVAVVVAAKPKPVA